MPTDQRREVKPRVANGTQMKSEKESSVEADVHWHRYDGHVGGTGVS